MLLKRVPRPATSTYRDEYARVATPQHRDIATASYTDNLSVRKSYKNFMLESKFNFWAPDFEELDYDILEVHSSDSGVEKEEDEEVVACQPEAIEPVDAEEEEAQPVEQENEEAVDEEMPKLQITEELAESEMVQPETVNHTHKKQKARPEFCAYYGYGNRSNFLTKKTFNVKSSTHVHNSAKLHNSAPVKSYKKSTTKKLGDVKLGRAKSNLGKYSDNVYVYDKPFNRWESSYSGDFNGKTFVKRPATGGV